MRLVLAIALGAVGSLASLGWADEPLTRVELNTGFGYLVTEKYGAAHQADFIANMIQYTPTIDFWTPTPTDCVVAERTLREMIHDGTKDPGAVFPSMKRSENDTQPSAELENEIDREQYELQLVEANYSHYARQFVGIIVDGQKIILCNFVDAPGTVPSRDYLFMQQVFAPKGVHILQAKFDPETKTCANVSLIGWWQELSEGS